MKGPAREAREIKVYRGDRGLRAEGWGGLRVVGAYSSLSPEARRAAEADVRANSVEVLRAFGLTRMADQKEAEARRAEEARLAEEARRKAEEEARRLAEEAARAAEEDRLRAAEEARLRAEEEARRADEELPRRLGISLEVWASMTPKARRLEAHRARLAGKL
jgi:membrane protein involved in colicin uptake